MDFLKGLFSSKPEDQSLNNSPEATPLESAPEEPKVEEDLGGLSDSNMQE